MLDRRKFVLGAAVTATLGTTVTTTLAGRAAAAPAPAVPAVGAGSPTRSAGVFTDPAGTAFALVHLDGAWVLVDVDGSVRITTGLAGADLVDVATDGDRVVAVGALSGDPTAAIWESTDGTTWREARRLHGVRSEFTAVGGGLALGSVVKQERASLVRIAARRTAGGWSTVPVRGLEWTDGIKATAVARTSAGWVAAAVGTAGTVLHTSRDGVTWSARSGLDEVAVRGLTPEGHWVGNDVVDATPLAGTLDAGRRRPDVPADAKALGVVGARTGWLAGGRLITAEAAR
ncbi:hypothetical protein [Saccharothrix sp. Mg75]|uniref:hypothetical protein n=1 Tax=Saccharothrix sp. Mg75 TaxID=3445357 RepID=UPI003EEA0B69